MVGLLDVQRKFLTQVDKTSLSLKVLIPGLLLHVLWNYIFVWYLDLGIMGTAIAMFITDFTNFIGFTRLPIFPRSTLRPKMARKVIMNLLTEL